MEYLGTKLLAKTTEVGVVKVGTNLTVDTDGTIHGNSNPDCITIRQELFTVGAGQTVFNLTEGSYNMNANSIFLYISGMKQDSNLLVELSSTSFSVVGDLVTGDTIMVEYIETLNVLIGIEGPQGDTGPTGNTGPQGASIIWLGAYSAGTNYAVRDAVSYLGSSYIMKVDAPAGTIPTNTTYWDILASKGDAVADSVEWANVLSKPTTFAAAQVFHAGTTAPANTILLWIDTN